MQSFSTRIWTRVAVSTSYDDNHYTTAPRVGKILMIAPIITNLNTNIEGRLNLSRIFYVQVTHMYFSRKILQY